jgi:transcription elongation factor Elf1
MLTEKELKKYLQNPDICPYCDSERLDSASLDYDTMTSQVICMDCNKSWWACYEITEIMEDE